LKILVIAALFSLMLLLLYSRIYPYILLLKKIFGGVAKTMADTESRGTSGSSTTKSEKSDGKLVRCVGCGTWIPAGRAIGNRAGSSVYCSRECIEKTSNGKERKIAG
jgi:hypothetical protein